MSEHGAPWWRPGVHHAARRDVAGAIYGLILATSVIAVSRQYEPHNAGVTAVTVIVTASVFWLAHVYTRVMALGAAEHHMPTWGQIQQTLDHEWPLVQAGILPTAVLLLGPLGMLEDDVAQEVAIGTCLLELGVTGIVVARAAGARGLLVGVSAAIAASFGVIVIVLKTVVH
jgi:hypothetical protein